MPRNSSCNLCPLHAGADSICVWGEKRGPYPTKIMILGQSPGLEENRSGRPFVGPSGRLLSEALEEAGLDSYYITNTVRCFPSTQKISKAHIKACSPYLDEEIAEQKPTHILALGNEAVQRLLGKGRVSEIAGKEIWSEKYQCTVVATWHPAYILRQMGRLGAWKADIYRFVRLVKGQITEKPPVSVRLVGLDLSFNDFRKMFIERAKRFDTFAFDFETSVFKEEKKIDISGKVFKIKIPASWWNHNWLAYTCSFSWNKEEAFVLPIDHAESTMGPRAHSFFKEVEPYVSIPECNAIGHNAALFDANVWWRLAGYPIYVKRDTMLEAHLNDENRPKRLKWLGGAILGWPNWDIDSTISHPLAELAEYNGYDTAATFALDEIQMEQMEPDTRKYFLALEMPKARAVSAIMRRGMYVDKKSLSKAIEVSISLMEEAASKIPVENPASNDQIAEWLYDREGLPAPHETDGGKPSTDKEAINELALRFPQAKIVREFRKHAKRLGTWLLPPREIIQATVDGRMHFDYKMLVETGRLSSSFHTNPKDKLVRGIYHAPPGWELVSCDYSQIEARLVAWLACGCPQDWSDPSVIGMLRAFLDGRDIYIEFAAEALRKSVSEVTRGREGEDSDERQDMGKVPTLAMLYKISPEGLQEYAWTNYELRYTISEARHLWQLFHDKWSEIHRWHEREERFLRVRGYARTPTGRYRHLPEVVGSRRDAATMESIRAGINAVPQNLASDINETAHILLEQKLDPRFAFVVGSHHDSLQVQTAVHYLQETVDLVRKYTSAAPGALRGLGLQLPNGLLKTEIAVGPWGTKS